MPYTHKYNPLLHVGHVAGHNHQVNIPTSSVSQWQDGNESSRSFGTTAKYREWPVAAACVGLEAVDESPPVPGAGVRPYGKITPKFDNGLARETAMAEEFRALVAVTTGMTPIDVSFEECDTQMPMLVLGESTARYSHVVTVVMWGQYEQGTEPSPKNRGTADMMLADALTKAGFDNAVPVALMAGMLEAEQHAAEVERQRLRNREQEYLKQYKTYGTSGSAAQQSPIDDYLQASGMGMSEQAYSNHIKHAYHQMRIEDVGAAGPEQAPTKQNGRWRDLLGKVFGDG